MMNGIEQSWLWITGAVMLLVGIGAGMLLARQLLPGAQKARELEKELEAAKADQARYRQQVTEHFEKTGELFQEMAQGYRTVYDHLARGAHQLCSEGTQTPRLDLPEAKLLSAVGSASEQAPEQASEQAPGQETASLQPETPPDATRPTAGGESGQPEKASPQTPAPEAGTQEPRERPASAPAATPSGEGEASAPETQRGDNEPEKSGESTAGGQKEPRPAVH